MVDISRIKERRKGKRRRSGAWTFVAISISTFTHFERGEKDRLLFPFSPYYYSPLNVPFSRVAILISNCHLDFEVRKCIWFLSSTLITPPSFTAISTGLAASKQFAVQTDKILPRKSVDVDEIVSIILAFGSNLKEGLNIQDTK